LVPAGGDPDNHTFVIDQVTHDENGETNVLKSATLSLRQLKEDFEKVTMTSMMSCSGQRRYEQNMVEKTGGAISWHNAVGNGTFGGVWLRDVLLHFGVSMDHKISKYVEFHGKEGFRSCVPFRKAMDSYGDCLVCYEMNGEPLHPDHGQPLRVVIPGYSAKCSCKWLTGISVRDRDCEHGKHKAYYKLFPASMRPGTEEYKIHHQDPEYTLGELNVNSCIFEPHSCTTASAPGPLTVTGYAHTGGGRSLARIEISGNGGKTWEQVRPLEQKLTEAGQLWAWVRFNHVLSYFDPRAPDAEIVVRAWDCAANTQPDWPQWNYTGMLNNHLYRVKVKPTADNQLVYVHPAQWMDPEFTPFTADKVAPKVVAHDSDVTQLLVGVWQIGSFSNSLVHLNVSKSANEVTSEEARWGGQRMQAKICTDSKTGIELEAEFCGFRISGLICECKGSYSINWKNGMCWERTTMADETSTTAGSSFSSRQVTPFSRQVTPFAPEDEPLRLA
jgi:DMSO/TMAO reductase YedYZ molybdopterin-dependent catalytic subunit